MKKLFSQLFFVVILAACDAFGAVPQPIVGGTPIPSNTPGIVTATPIILTPTNAQTAMPGVTEIVPVTPTNTETPLPTFTNTPLPPTETATLTLTSTPMKSVSVDILGCNTSIDITHGMGEVTNAYVTVKNTGMTDLPNTCALLRAIDEDREHPNKKVCIPNLPVQNQVTLKLTVDSTYKQNTIIQVDTTSNDVILLRVDKPSCTDIGLFGGEPADLGTVKPIE
jgi:hypothetical protein